MDMKGRLLSLSDSYEEHLRKLVGIKSIMNENEDGTPYGKDIQRALELTAEIAEELGFKSYLDPGGHYAYADIGEGDKMIGILGHVDVVPPGDLSKWKTDPFTLVKKDGFLYGRGTQDDKGPLLAAMYAVKALSLEGYAFTKKIRFIFGPDEENLWRGIKKYTASERIPDCGFSPDSSFPLIYAEKGLLQVVLESPNDSGITLTAGEAFNIVPDKASYFYSAELESVITSDYEINEGVITVFGKSAHSAKADRGINAITRLVTSMKKAGYSSKAIDFISDMMAEPHAEAIFGNISDESGRLTCNIGMLEIDKAEKISLDLRIPVTYKKRQIENALREKASLYGFSYAERDFLEAIHVPVDSELVISLMDAYSSVTGDNKSKPMISGGATYARATHNCVAFGSVFQNGEKTEHQPNERIAIDDMFIAMEVYGEAIKRLVENNKI